MRDITTLHHNPIINTLLCGLGYVLSAIAIVVFWLVPGPDVPPRE